MRESSEPRPPVVNVSKATHLEPQNVDRRVALSEAVRWSATTGGATRGDVCSAANMFYKFLTEGQQTDG